MKIIASSAVPHEAVFLHAGYISSMPRPFEMQFSVDVEKTEKTSSPPLFLNISKALQLKHETSISAVNPAVAAPLPPPPTESSLAFSSLPVMALGVVVFFGFVWLLYYLRKFSSRIATAVLLIALLLISLGMFFPSERINNDDNSTKVSYAAHLGVPSAGRYKNPYAATTVIMHGLLADGVINSRGTITSLDQINKEVAFPTTKLTSGMKHALDNYAYDGWGRRFVFSTQDGNRGSTRYKITSLGPDGVQNTKDDIIISFDKADEESWDRLRWGLFALREGNNLLVFFHRWPGGLFNYLNQGIAWQRSGSNLFDVWCSDKDYGDSLDRIKKSEEWKLFATIREGELFLWMPAWRTSKL